MASIGAAYSVVVPTRSNAATTEVAVLWVSNPAGSGVTSRAHSLYVAPDGLSTNEEIIIRLYRNPTVTSNGTAATINSSRPRKAVTSKMLAYTLPTTSSNGTKIAEFYATTAFALMEDSLSLFFDQGQSLLITVQQSSNGINYTTDLTWREPIDPA